MSPAATPADWRPRTVAATSSPTATGSSPNERIPIAGLRGFVARSQTGAYATLTPIARHSRPIGARDALGQVRVAGRAEGHVAGERRRSVAEAEQLAGLLVGGDEDRERGTRGRCLDGRRQRADLAGRVDVRVAEERDPRRGLGRQSRPDVSGERQPVEREHQRPERRPRTHRSLTP